MTGEVILGDCLKVMKRFPDGHFDSVIVDPPYGTTALDFDQTPIDWAAWWAEVHRVTKETAVIVCFAADLFTVDLIQSNRKKLPLPAGVGKDHAHRVSGRQPQAAAGA